MNLEDMMLSEKVTHRRIKLVWFHFYEVSRAIKFIGTESKRATRGWREEGEFLLDYGVLKNIWK